MVNDLKIGIIPNFTREKAFDVTKNTIAELEKLNIDYYFDINSKNDFTFYIEEFHFIDKIYEFVDVIINKEEEVALDPIDESGNIAEPLREKQQEEIFENITPIVEQDPPMEVMNGDPSVIIPSNDIEPKKEDTIEEVAFKETFKNVKLENKKNNRIDRSFGYSWNGIEMDY